MPSQTWGRITATGDADFIALVRAALDEAAHGYPLPDKYENLPPHAFTISQHTPADMIANGAIIPGSKSEKRPQGIAAYGKVFDFNDLWLNSRIVATRPRLAKHVVRHEIAHTLKTTAADRQAFLQLMYKEDGTHPKKWAVGRYEARPEECRADTIAELVSGIDSPWDDFAYYDLDVKPKDVNTFMAIVIRSLPAAVVAEPPDAAPEVTPPPTTVEDTQAEQIMELQAQVDELTRDLEAAKAECVSWEDWYKTAPGVQNPPA